MTDGYEWPILLKEGISLNMNPREVPLPKKPNLRRRLWFVCCLLGSGIVMLFLYTLLHEGGHALVGILYGGKVDRMVLGLNAHVSISGAVYSQAGEALLNVAGLLLPLLFLVVALVVYQAKFKSALYHIFHAVMWMGISSSLLAWVIIPIVALVDRPPVGDDTTNFLSNTGLHPLLLILMAMLIITGLIMLAIKRGLFAKIAGLFRSLFQAEFQKGKLVFLLRTIIGVVLVFAIVLIGFRMLAPTPVLKTMFSMTVSQDTGVLRLPFEVKQSKAYSMSLSLDASGLLTDIQIYNEAGDRIYQNLAEWFTLEGYGTLKLEQGQYEMILTFLLDPQDMEGHFRKMGYDFTADEIAGLAEVFATGQMGGQETSQVTSQGQGAGHQIRFSATIK